MAEQAANTILQVAPFVVFLSVIALRTAQGRIDTARLGLRSPLSSGAMAIWVVGFITYVAAAELTLNQLGLLEVASWRFSFPWWLLRAAGIAVLAPICEEILFRGFLLNVLERRTGNFHFAVLVQALAFVAAHAFAYDNSIGARIGIAQTFVDACLFAYARRHTGSLWTPILMHAAANAVAVLERMLL